MQCMTHHILILHSFLHPVFLSLHKKRKHYLYSKFQVFSIHQSSTMVPEMEKPRVTEIKVRMDCNGCVQKIKKALNGITGIYDIYVDFPQQKITIIGWADPVKIVKAIKKTRKTAVICSHTEQSDQPTSDPPPESGGTANEGGAPPPPESNNPPTEQQQQQQQTEPPPPSPPEPQKDSSPPPPNNPPSDESANETKSQHAKPKEVEQIHVVYHHPPDYSHRYAAYGGYLQQGFIRDPQPQPQPQTPQPIYFNHSYSTYKPSPYVTEYAYPHSQPEYSHYSRPEQYNQVYQSPQYSNYNRAEQYNQVNQSQPVYSNYSPRPDHYTPVYYSANYNNNNNNGNGNVNGNITSMFSEENPNACSIV